MLSGPMIASFRSSSLGRFRGVREVYCVRSGYYTVVCIKCVCAAVTCVVRLSGLCVGAIGRFKGVSFRGGRFCLSVGGKGGCVPCFAALFRGERYLRRPCFLVGNRTNRVFMTRRFCISSVGARASFAGEMCKLFRVNGELCRRRRGTGIGLGGMSCTERVTVNVGFLLRFAWGP